MDLEKCTGTTGNGEIEKIRKGEIEKFFNFEKAVESGRLQEATLYLLALGYDAKQSIKAREDFLNHFPMCVRCNSEYHALRRNYKKN